MTGVRHEEGKERRLWRALAASFVFLSLYSVVTGTSTRRNKDIGVVCAHMQACACFPFCQSVVCPQQFPVKCFEKKDES